MRIALAQINPTVGDVAGNTALILEAITRGREARADCLLLPELSVLGYPPRDLLLREGVVERCEEAVARIVAASEGITVVVGHPSRAENGRKPAHNSATICRDGHVVGRYDKNLLPGYDVFDEDRWFEPGGESPIFDLAGMRAGVLICEDLWRARDTRGGANLIPDIALDPVAQLVERGCEILLVPSASPFVMGKGARHVEQLCAVAREQALPIVLVNQTGGNDDLVFDGRSIAVSKSGDVIHRCPGFESDFAVVELDSEPLQSDTSPAGARDHPMDELFRALVLGVRDYVAKTNHRRVTIGLSGGIDSALTAALAGSALGADNVTGVMMPSRYSSSGSIDDAQALAANLRIENLHRVSIADAHETMVRGLMDTLTLTPGEIADQNIQARLRGIILMAFANETGSLVLVTGNKSELAAGYTTLYGDMAGALAPLGDVLKTQIYELSTWINTNHAACGFSTPPIPQASIDKPPSAELRPDQTDQDTLPPYATLDEIIRRYVDLEQSIERIGAETGFDAELVCRTARGIDRNEYKRMQSAIILKVSPRAFGPGRPMPVAMRET